MNVSVWTRRRLLAVVGLVALGLGGWVVATDARQPSTHDTQPLGVQLVSDPPGSGDHEHGAPGSQGEDHDAHSDQGQDGGQDQDDDGQAPGDPGDPGDGQEAPGDQDDSDQDQADDPDGPGDQDDQDDEPGPPGDGGPDAAPPDGAEQADPCDPSGLPPHDGQQEGLRCVPTPMGAVPALTDIPAVLITNPEPGATLPADQPFVVEATVGDLVTGAFAEPDTGYYQTPQRLDENGQIIGHAHIAIQRLDAAQDAAQAPSDAQDLAFFQGLEQAADADGEMTAIVPGLDAGTYRIVVNTSSFSHQPVLSPVARHMPSVDGIRVQVIGTNDPASGSDAEDGDTAGGAADPSGDDPAPADSQDPVEPGTPQPEAVAVQGTPGDGIPPVPPNGDGGRSGAGDGGAGDGRPPPPSSARSSATTAPATPGAAGDGPPSESINADSSLPFSGFGLADGLLVGAGVLALVGLALLAAGRRHRRPRRYQGRHLVVEEPPAATEQSGLTAELDRLWLPEEPDQARR